MQSDRRKIERLLRNTIAWTEQRLPSAPTEVHRKFVRSAQSYAVHCLRTLADASSARDLLRIGRRAEKLEKDVLLYVMKWYDVE